MKKEDQVLENIGFEGLFVPMDVLKDKGLGNAEKELLSLFMMYEEGVAKQVFLLLHSERTYARAKTSLRKKGRYSVKVKNVEQAKQFAIAKSHEGGRCDWCNKNSFVLQKHHFPTPKKLGGKETVNICPNCHYTFHAVVGYDYE